MDTLHILNKSPDHPRFAACIDALGADDALLLIENGVFALAALPAQARPVYVLEADLAARGVDPDSKGYPDVVTVDYGAMVRLSQQAWHSISW